ncbi:MAG: hypothetical protein IT373_21285, partial [Polyangiaceae bacterium]|nr:hypothetical protein [Polyangiaceae bacterium]
VRIVAGLTGVSMGIGTLVGLIHTLRAPTPGTSPFMIAGGLLPAALLVRYALTGRAKT